MNFEKKKIGADNQQEELKPSNSTKEDQSSKIEKKTTYTTLALGITVIAVLVFGIGMLVKSLDFSGIIFSFGKSLKTDPTGHTNILIAGVGGEGHDGGNLTDSLMVANIDYDHKMVSMLSIPRDLYVKNEVAKGGARINEVFGIAKNMSATKSSKEGMEGLTKTVSSITGMPIDYYIKVDFSGFVKIVDGLGGLDVVVEKDIYDPEYPLGETTKYQTFSIKAGPQTLDGEKALKYARSRKGINSGGDFGRAKRQQQLIMAIKEKALGMNIITDPGKIQSLYRSVADSVETNLSVDEIIELAKASKEFGKENIMSTIMTTYQGTCGGLLYFPDRKLFGDASIELPAGKGYESIHELTDLIFNHVDIMKDKPEIQVLNGTKTKIAGDVANFLNQLCFNVTTAGNAEKRDLQTTTIYYQPGPKGEKPAVLDFIKKYLPYTQVAGIPEAYLADPQNSGTKVVIELGADYLQNKVKDPFDFLPYAAAPNAVTPTSQESSTQVQTKPSAGTKPGAEPSSTTTSPTSSSTSQTTRNQTP